jgi:hypothetical protein
MWKDLNNQNDVDDFMKQFNMFHDAYMLETKYITGTYEQTSADIFIKSTMYILFQLDKLRCLEMELDMLDRFAINLNLKCSFEIYEARFEKKKTVFIGTVTSMRTKMRTTGSAAKPSAGEKSRWPINLMEAAPMVRKENSLCLLNLAHNMVLKQICDFADVKIY